MGYFANMGTVASGSTGYGIYSSAGASGNSWAAYLIGKSFVSYRLGIGNNNPAFALQLSTNGAAKPTSSAWTVFSDRRLKKNIQVFEDGLNVINAINPVWFTYNGKEDIPEETGVGTVAQELLEIAPYMVKETLINEGGNVYLTVDYGAMDFILINAIKEQQSIIDNLSKENSLLKENYQSLLSRIEKLEANSSN